MRDEVAVFRGYCYELTLTPPYGAWVEAIAGVSVESQPVSPAALLRADWNSQSITSRSALFDRIHSFLVDLTATHPVVLVLEDLHWSDPASLELLRLQARSIHSLAVLIVATYRADELTRDHPFYRLLPSIVRESHAARLELQPLTDDDVQALIRARYALSPRDESHLVAYLRSRVEGNPFYLSEVLRTLEAERHLLPGADRWSVQELDHVPVPPLVRQTIEERLAWLDVEDRRLLEIAAAIGQGVPINVWLAASMTGNDQIAATIQRAIGARVFVEPPEPARVRFTHALVRETLYEGMAVPERKVVHRRIAEILADQPDPIPRTIASHFVRADDPRAIGWLTRDGVEALAVYAAEDAVAAINQAQDLAVRFDEELPLGAYRTRAAAHVMLGEFDEARRDHEVVRERG